jgi:hypothetical protein
VRPTYEKDVHYKAGAGAVLGLIQFLTLSRMASYTDDFLNKISALN